MRWLRAGLVGAALAALAVTWVIAQTIVPGAISGNECWNAGQGPGGPSTGFVCTNQMRGGTAQAVLSAVSGSFTIGTATGNFTNSGSPSMTQLLFGGKVLINAQPSAATITLPPNPIDDGTDIGICNVTASAWTTNTVTAVANSNQTLVGTPLTLTTLAAGTCQEVIWNQANATWYRVR